MRFKNGKDMLECLHDSWEFYNPKKEIYVFEYNSAGSICYYNIDNEEANRLRILKEESNNEEYWGAFLGVGGWIVDDPSYEDYQEGDYSNLDWCNDNFDGDWEIV